MHLHLPGQRVPTTSLAPNTKHPPPPSLVHAGARANWSCSGPLALLSGELRQTCHAKALAIPAPSARSLALQGFSTKTITHAKKLRADKFFEVEMTVRDNELDQYGVVHNAMYVVYIHDAREEMATCLGVSTASVVRNGNAMALSELNLKYFAPLKRGEKFVVKVRVVQIKGARILIDHFIETLPDRKLILEATTAVVCLNKDYRPTRVFREMSSKLQQFFSSKDT